MSLDMWAACEKQLDVLSLIGEVYRVVESQRQIATHQLVDDLSEQALLEELLEQSKPAPPAAAGGLHYLLSTPFRYPPLRHGSRFGRRYEPSLFYGARKLGTALTETAYYRLRFWHDMAKPPPSGRLVSQHTAFTATINVDKGLQLQHRPCSEFEDKITDPCSHQATQTLGSAMRAQGIQAFEYPSARDPAHGLNVALFYPQAFRSRRPGTVMQLLCATRDTGVEFIDEKKTVHTRLRREFLVEGAFPIL